MRSPLLSFVRSAVTASAFRYEKRKRRSDPDIATYHFVGYSTIYPFYCFPEKVRMRLRYVRRLGRSPSPLPLTSLRVPAASS